jgi:hypothetical protein
MYHCYVKLDLDRGLGRFIGHPCGNGEEMITPQQFRRDARTTLDLLERHNWILPTRGEILASCHHQVCDNNPP